MRVSGNQARTPKMNSMNAAAQAGPTGHRGTGKCSLATSSLLMLRRITICDSRIISHTQTIEKVTTAAKIRNRFSGAR
ncbi:hypothetical protein D3C72_1365510 [compost metagenome]